jgi:hypothetical protein
LRWGAALMRRGEDDASVASPPRSGARRGPSATGASVVDASAGPNLGLTTCPMITEPMWPGCRRSSSLLRGWRAFVAWLASGPEGDCDG